MIKYFCDKCGKEVEYKFDLTLNNIRIQPGSVVFFKDALSTWSKQDEEVALCPDCQEELRRWLKLR